MSTKATYNFFPRPSNRQSNKHDTKHNTKSLIGPDPHAGQRRLTNNLSRKYSDSSSNKLRSLRLFAFPNTTSTQHDILSTPSQLSPDCMISPMTSTSTPVFLDQHSIKTNATDKGVTILDVTTLNETGNNDARYKETAIIPRQHRPILCLFSRRQKQNKDTNTRHARRLFRDFTFPTQEIDDKENSTDYKCMTGIWDEDMVSPRTTVIATFGYGYARITNVAGYDGHNVVVDRRLHEEYDDMRSAGSKRSWDEYDADDESLEDDDGVVLQEVEEES